MANRRTDSITIAELPAGCRDRDEDMLQALVTAGALVALADGELAPVERGELLDFINQHGFIPTISRQDAAAAFDSRVRQLQTAWIKTTPTSSGPREAPDPIDLTSSAMGCGDGQAAQKFF